MAETPPQIPIELGPAGTTQGAGQRIDEDKGRIFPCESCGADLKFEIGKQSLECPYCGHVKPLQIDENAEVTEQDFEAMLARLAELRESGQTEEVDTSQLRCESCGGTVVFTGTLTSSECPYCGSPIQREKIHDAVRRVQVDGVLPFQVDRDRARNQLKGWVQSRWFAPNEFTKRGVEGRFNGIYLPFWTFDTLTGNQYRGERGEHYWVEVGTGKNRHRVQRTRWYPAHGFFQRFFDDVLVSATQGLLTDLIAKLEPWPLDACLPFNQQSLAGFLARTYDIPLAEGFQQAKTRIDAAIDHEVRSRIGGDTQRVHSIHTDYEAITYKHLLLPVWLLAYRYRERTYQVVVNAATGEVQGERPYSWVKITLAVIAGAALAGGLALLAQTF